MGKSFISCKNSPSSRRCSSPLLFLSTFRLNVQRSTWGVMHRNLCTAFISLRMRMELGIIGGMVFLCVFKE